MTGARVRLTPAAASCWPHVLADAFSCTAPQPPWVSAVGIRENPGPWSTCTLPPSWSTATTSGTFAVAAAVAAACSRWVTARVADTLAWLRPVRITEPTCWRRIAPSTAALAVVAGVPAMNSWPARCAGVIRRYAARTGGGTGDVDGAGSVPGVGPVVEDGEAGAVGGGVGGAVRDGTADAEVVGDVRFAVVELRADGLPAEGVPAVGLAPEEVDGAAAADAG